jgi:hypothetical protein
MGIGYIVTPVTNELLAWGRECGVPVPADVAGGRCAALDELRDVLASLEGYTYTITGTLHDFSARVDSTEMIEFNAHYPDPSVDAALGGLRLVPREDVQWEALTDRNGRRFMSCHGDVPLIVKIAQRLTTACGPLAVFSSYDGIPAILLAHREQPIWKEPWY